MIPTKVWGYVGIGLALLALVGAVLWQMNIAVKRGIELGEANAVIKDLRGKLKEQRAEEQAKWEKLKAEVVECNERVDAAVAAGENLREAYQEIKQRPPREVIVEIESTTWHESLVEGHGKLLAGLEEIRNETPYPPG